VLYMFEGYWPLGYCDCSKLLILVDYSDALRKDLKRSLQGETQGRALLPGARDLGILLVDGAVINALVSLEVQGTCLIGYGGDEDF
jgi:hypothetical protein